MKIDQFLLTQIGDRVRASAKVTWEDCDRAPQELYFETDAEFSDGFSCNPHAFLVACILPAFRFGEKRIILNEEICPELKDGLITVMGWMRHWHYGPKKGLVEIEGKKQSSPTIPRTRERTGFFFSGGIDSLATLRSNRLNYPLEHPGSIKDGLLVCGLEVHDAEKFRHLISPLSEIARDAGITLIQVFTNIRDIGPSDISEFWGDFWVNEFESAAFSAIAHTFSKRLTKIFYSSTYDIPNILRFGNKSLNGTHPLIDPQYSSSDLQIKLCGIWLSRFQKTKLIADWDVALRNFRVCNITTEYQAGNLNCGKCEKCLRTKLALLALGALDRAHAFSNREISPEIVKSNVTLSRVNLMWWEELVAPLTEKGYHDLAGIIMRKLTKKRMIYRTIGPIKDFDKKYLNGNLLRLKRLVYKKGISY
jgi:hypothetical protein